MAFFGITTMGHQNPIGDKMVLNSRGVSLSQDSGMNSRCWSQQPLPETLRCTDTCGVYLQPLPHSADIHHGSQERYKDMVKRVQTPRSPNQLYLMPLTDNQRYGWLISQDQKLESWAKVKRYPRKNSEMTKFVKEMSMSDRDFNLF